jgi:mono/diheme cytochrome c family protein
MTYAASQKSRGSRPRPAGAALCAALAFVGVFASVGCRGDRSEEPPRMFFPDMDHQPKVKAQTKSTFFQEFEGGYGEEDWGRASRLPVEGTVPWGRWSVAEPEIMGVDFAQRQTFLALDPERTAGKTTAGEVIDTIPIDVDDELLLLGQKKYEIYCIACHGGTGAGDGMVGVRWSAPVPSYHLDRYQKGAVDGDGNPTPTALDGHLFDVIRNGVATPPGIAPALRMPAYGNKVSVDEAWAIVAYVRALQASRRGDVEQLPAADRERLMAQKRDEAGTAVADGGER